MIPWTRAAKAFRLSSILISAAVLFLTACAEDDGAVPLPTRAAPHLVSPSPSVEEAIKRAYIAFIDILDHADSLPEDTRRQQLSLFMADPQLTKVIGRIKEMKRKNLAAYGRVVTHIQGVTLDGRDASLRDCQDSSAAGTKNILTQKKLNRGIGNENIKAYLSRGSDGRWRITKTVSFGQGC